MFQTLDHKPTTEPEFGRLTRAGGLIAGGRVQGQLAVSRAFGDFNLKARKFEIDHSHLAFAPPNYNPHRLHLVLAEPDISVLDISDLQDTDHNYLCLACDGLFDVCTSSRLAQLLEDKRSQLDETTKNPLEAITSYLVQFAYDNRSVDNISVMVIQL